MKYLNESFESFLNEDLRQELSQSKKGGSIDKANTLKGETSINNPIETGMQYNDLFKDSNELIQMKKSNSKEKLETDMVILSNGGYSSAGGNKDFGSIEDVLKMDWKKIDKNDFEKLVLIGDEGKFGFEVKGIGSKDISGGKSEIIIKLVDMLSDNGNWMECEEDMYNELELRGAKNLEIEDIMYMFKDLQVVDREAGVYRRGGKTVKMFGNPRFEM